MKSLTKIKLNLTVWHFFIPIVPFVATLFTEARIIHLFWSIVFSLIPIIIFFLFNHFSKISSSQVFIAGVAKSHQYFMILFVLFLGSWLPDIDWLFKSHRSPISHSVIPFLIMYRIIKNRNFNRFEHQLLAFFAFALSSHLITDIGPGNVVCLPAYIDLPFLLINGVTCFYFAVKILKQGYKI